MGALNKRQKGKKKYGAARCEKKSDLNLKKGRRSWRKPIGKIGEYWLGKYQTRLR